MSKPYAIGMFLLFFGTMLIASSFGGSDITSAITAASFTGGLSLMLKFR
jgi:hypothetical protein